VPTACSSKLRSEQETAFDGLQSLKPEKFYQLMDEVRALERVMKNELGA